MKKLEEKQYDLELFMRDAGQTAFLKETVDCQLNGKESETGYGSKIISHNIHKVSEAIREFINETSTGKSQRNGKAAKYLKDVQFEISALIALRTLINSVTSKVTLANASVQIGTAIEDELQFSSLSKDHPGLFSKLSSQTKGSTSHRHRRAVFLHAMKSSGIKDDGWPTATKAHVGTKLIDLIIQSTGLVKVVNIKTRSGKYARHVVATDELVKWVEDYVSKSSLMVPKLLPCVVKPAKWFGMYGGGYHYPELTGYNSLVKCRSKKHTKALERNSHKLWNVYKAVNTLQDTAWTINNDVLDIANQLWEVGGDVCGLPRRDAFDLPTRPEDIDHNPETLKTWKKSASKVHEANNKLSSKRIETSKILWIAEKFKYEEDVYFPYQLDFRGRAYATPIYLTPQGNDLSKSLLKFSEGKELGHEEAVKYLAVHGANCFGYDKASLEDRYEFIKSKSDMIKITMQDPLSYKWWMDADEPFCFLSFMFEWVGYLEQGLKFKSRIPIAMDASCSGIQHFSAMTLDKEGGEAVNLTPSIEKSDIYQKVCDVFIRKLEELLTSSEVLYTDDAAGGDVYIGDAAKMWLDLNPDRSTTKRQVMVLPYGGTIYSCKEYTFEWLIDKRLSEITWGPDNNMKQASFAAGLIWASIQEVVLGARETMDWLQTNITTAYKSGYSGEITWQTPSGFLVLQEYFDTKLNKISTKLNDTSVYLYLRKETDKINKVRMRNSVSPNFVHSMDAAHMTLTINMAVSEGLKNFSIIHDSFGTYASDTYKLGYILRNRFISMYSENNVLEQFQKDISKNMDRKIKDKLPPSLVKGELDLNSVKESEYCFS